MTDFYFVKHSYFCEGFNMQKILFPFLKECFCIYYSDFLSTHYYLNNGNLRGIQSLFMSVGRPRQKCAKSSAYLDTLFKYYMKQKRKKVS